MSEASKVNTSCFLISLDTREGKDCITSLTQEVPELKGALLKSKSHITKMKNSNLLNEEEESADDENLADSMSIIEESHSWLTQTEPRLDSRHQASKPRKSAKKYNRKEKSLGELCKKFIYLYGSKNYCIIALDECTYTLGVERRRIYDIINILESFNVLSRLAKNQYEWRGIGQIKNSIQRMRQINDEDNAAAPMKMKKKKKKSLGILCESFIKQFLNWRTTISLEQAARRISDNHIDESKLKTKVRRLYDIANVLAALNLIEKTSLETRKPAFKWVGEEGLEVFIEEMETYFETHKTDEKCSEAFIASKTSRFEFKSELLKSTENPARNRGFERLNSGSTTTTFKAQLHRKDEELEFGTSLVEIPKVSAVNDHHEMFNPISPQIDMNVQLMELLEKLTVNQVARPVYRPTPVYPINHLLSTSYTVSILKSDYFRN